jgi:hypothetical protein
LVVGGQQLVVIELNILSKTKKVMLRMFHEWATHIFELSGKMTRGLITNRVRTIHPAARTC